MTTGELAAAVGERTGLAPREAERTLVVVLRALCGRLEPGQARGLLAQLPAPLTAGLATTEVPMPMSRDDFVVRVVRELGVNPAEARERVRAVFAALREAACWGQLDAVLLELDPDYADLLA